MSRTGSFALRRSAFGSLAHGPPKLSDGVDDAPTARAHRQLWGNLEADTRRVAGGRLQRLESHGVTHAGPRLDHPTLTFDSDHAAFDGGEHPNDRTDGEQVRDCFETDAFILPSAERSNVKLEGPWRPPDPLGEPYGGSVTKRLRAARLWGRLQASLSSDPYGAESTHAPWRAWTAIERWVCATVTNAPGAEREDPPRPGCQSSASHRRRA